MTFLDEHCHNPPPKRFRVALPDWLCFAVAIVLTASLAGLGCSDDVTFADQFTANCPAEPVFNLLQPQEGQVVTESTVPFNLVVGTFTIAPLQGQPNTDCTGHLHLFVNGDLVITAETVFDLDLSAQPAAPIALVVEVHNNDHSIVEGIPAITRNFTFAPTGGGVGGLLARYSLDGDVEDSSSENDATFYLEGYGEDRAGNTEAAASYLSRQAEVTIEGATAFSRPLVIAPHLGYSSDFTIAAWFFHYNPRENVRILGEGNWFSLYLLDGHLELGRLMERVPTGTSVHDPSGAPDNRWGHVAGVVSWDGYQSELILYVDGLEVAREVAMGTEMINDSSCPFFIGPNLGYLNEDPVAVAPGGAGVYVDAGSECDATQSLTSFAGLIDDVAVYDRALSASEIQELYDAVSD